MIRKILLTIFIVQFLNFPLLYGVYSIGYNKAYDHIYSEIKTSNFIRVKDIGIKVEGRPLAKTTSYSSAVNNYLEATGQSICANCHMYK
jgi:hypothetical protein